MSESTSLEVPVVEVTLMEDRARIMRRGSAHVVAGRHRLRVEGVAPVLVDKTLVVRAESAGAGLRVLDARVLRSFVSSSPDLGASSTDAAGKAAELRKQRKALAVEITRAAAEIKRCDYKCRGLVRAGRLSLAEVAQDVAYGKPVAGSWNVELGGLRSNALELMDQEAVLRAAQAERNERLLRLDEQLRALQSPADREWACVEIDVECASDVEGRFEIDYAVPGACWRPYHRARLIEGEQTRVRFETEACIWQNTGEDWSAVEVILSTERASLGVEPPELASDTLVSQKKSSTLQIESREQSVESVPSAGGARDPELPGIDDGGSALHLRVSSPCNLPSDGRPHRVVLSAFDADAELSLVAMPELNPCVLLATTLENAGDTPLLAGPVDLIRNSGLIGRTKILYVAGGERFELGWGPEADLRLRRENESSLETSRVLSAWKVRKHVTRVRLSNLGQRSHTLKVSERVPVSEIDKVKIEVDAKKTSDNRQPDANGFVEWQVEIGPMGHKTLELHYALKKHDDVQG